MSVDSYRRTVAFDKYNSAKNSLTNRDIAEGKMDRIDHALGLMREAKSLFAQSRDSKMELYCDGYIWWWEADKEWLLANNNVTIQRIEMRKRAVETIDKANECFSKLNSKTLQNEIIRHRHYWSGIIAAHEMNIGTAKEHFIAALEIAKASDIHSVAYYQAAIADCDAWDLVWRRFNLHQSINYELIAMAFEKAVELYKKTSDTTAITYMEGWMELFQFLSNPSADRIPLFFSFEKKVFAVEKEEDEKIRRLWLKKSVGMNASDQFKIVQDHVYPYYVVREFDKIAEELGNWLRNKLYSEKITLRDELRKESLEMSYRTAKVKLKIDDHPSIDWLVTWRSKSKHDIWKDDKLKEVMDEALKNASLLETLPKLIEKFKQEVNMKCKQRVHRR